MICIDWKFLCYKTATKLNTLQKQVRNTVVKKIASGEYDFAYINCPSCDSDINQHVMFSEHDMYGINMDLAICKNCGLVFNNPQASVETLNDFYLNYYRKLDRGCDFPPDSFFQLQYRKGQLLHDFIKPHLKDVSGIVLEIGCGAGGILKFFSDRGFNVLGIDIDAQYLEYGMHRHGLNLKQMQLRDFLADKKSNNIKISAVILEQVLEHFKNPVEELKYLHELIDDDTVVFIGVPGLKNIAKHYGSNLNHYLQFPHLIHFELRTLNNMLSEQGFSSIIGNEKIHALYRKSKPSDVYISDQIDFDSVKQYLKALKRKVYIGRCFNVLTHCKRALYRC